MRHLVVSLTIYETLLHLDYRRWTSSSSRKLTGCSPTDSLTNLKSVSPGDALLCDHDRRCRCARAYVITSSYMALRRPVTVVSEGLVQEFVPVTAEREKVRPALLAALCKRTCRPGVIIFRRKKLAHESRRAARRPDARTGSKDSAFTLRVGVLTC